MGAAPPYHHAPQGHKNRNPMPDSFVQILTHITFHVKADAPTILEEHLPRVFEYLGGEVRGLGGNPFAIGGRPDHVHILTTLPKTRSLSDFLMNIMKSDSDRVLGRVVSMWT